MSDLGWCKINQYFSCVKAQNDTHLYSRGFILCFAVIRNVVKLFYGVQSLYCHVMCNQWFYYLIIIDLQFFMCIYILLIYPIFTEFLFFLYSYMSLIMFFMMTAVTFSYFVHLLKKQIAFLVFVK
jgi:hypothetical protein